MKPINIQASLRSIIIAVVENHGAPEFDKPPEDREWVKALVAEVFAYSRLLAHDTAAESRHRDQMELNEKMVQANLQANEVQAAINAEALELQKKRDARWEELCVEQNKSIESLAATLEQFLVIKEQERRGF